MTVSGICFVVPPATVRTSKVNVLFAVADVVGVIVNCVEPDPETAVGEKA